MNAHIAGAYDHSDFEANPEKYTLYKTAKIALDVTSSHEFSVGELVNLQFICIQKNMSYGNKPMPIYIVHKSEENGRKMSMLFACALGDFCL